MKKLILSTVLLSGLIFYNQKINAQCSAATTNPSPTNYLGFNATNTSYDLHFSTIATPQMTLQYSTGFLGINTTTPGHLIDTWNGDINASSSSGLNGFMSALKNHPDLKPIEWASLDPEMILEMSDYR